MTRRLQEGGHAAGGRSRKGRTARVARRAQASPAAYAFLVVVLLASAFPLWWSFVIGSKDAAAINSGEVSLLPGGNFIENARTVVTTLPFWRAFLNSVIVSTVVAAAVVLLSTLAGSPSLRFRGRDALLVFVIATMCVPTQLGSSHSSSSWPSWAGSAVGGHPARTGQCLRRVLDDAVPARGTAGRADRGRARRWRVDAAHRLERRAACCVPRCSGCSPSSRRGRTSSGRSSCWSREPDPARRPPAAPGRLLRRLLARPRRRRPRRDPPPHRLRRRRAAARVRHYARSSQGMTLNLTSSGRHAKAVAGEQDSTARTRVVPDGFVLGVATAAYQIEGRATRTGAPTRSGTPSRTPRARSSTETPVTSRATTTTTTSATLP